MRFLRNRHFLIMKLVMYGVNHSSIEKTSLLKKSHRLLAELRQKREHAKFEAQRAHDLELEAVRKARGLKQKALARGKRVLKQFRAGKKAINGMRTRRSRSKKAKKSPEIQKKPSEAKWEVHLKVEVEDEEEEELEKRKIRKPKGRVRAGDLRWHFKHFVWRSAVSEFKAKEMAKRARMRAYRQSKRWEIWSQCKCALPHKSEIYCLIERICIVKLKFDFFFLNCKCALLHKQFFFQ